MATFDGEKQQDRPRARTKNTARAAAIKSQTNVLETMSIQASNLAQFTDTSRYILDAAQAHVLGLFNEKRDRRLVYHNFAHTAEVVRLVGELGRAGHFSTEILEVAQLAAWFHATGYLYDYAGFVEKSAVSAEFFLAERRYEPSKIHRVRQCIVAALSPIQPKPLESQLLADAVSAATLTENFEKKSPLLRLEWELAEGRKLTDAGWQDHLGQALLNAHFHTAQAKILYEPPVARQLLKLRELVDNQQVTKENIGDLTRFDRLGKQGMRSAIQTFFRSNYSTHIQLSAIADGKAHIMISVNSILLSVAVSMLTYQTTVNQNPMLMLPIVIFIVASLFSLIFAVLSARPKVTTWQGGEMKNLIFFGNFVHLTLEQYEQGIDQMLRDGKILYAHMTRDMYFLGQVLDKKYRFLTLSYTIFMVGFVATVAAFLAAYFLQNAI